jgi:hypothetical protein
MVIRMFKSPLEKLLSGITSLKYKGLDIDFGKRLEEVAREIEQTIPQPPNLLRAPTTLANLHPAAAILEAWLDFEAEFRDFANKQNIPNSQKLPTTRIADELLKQEVWDATTFHIFSELRQLRNTVVHTRSGAITPAQAIEYQVAVQRLLAKLKKS